MIRSKTRLIVAPLVAASLLMAFVPTSVAGSQPREASAQPNHTLGIILDSASDLAGIQLLHGAQAAAKTAGWTVLDTDAQSEPSKAIATMEDYVSRGVTAILVEVINSALITGGIRAAVQAHIPVISWGGGLAPGVAMSSEQNGGAVVANDLLKAMGGKGVGSIITFVFHEGLPCIERAQGFASVMKGYPNITVNNQAITLTDATATGESATDAWLLTKPKAPVGIFGCYDDPSVGAIAALKQLHYKPGEVKVVGFNAGATALADIKAGWMTGSLFFDNVGAGKFLFTDIKQILAEGSKWKPVMTEMPSIFVTRSNLGWFESHYGNV
jgi:ribose transport system substrate-binding protein